MFLKLGTKAGAPVGLVDHKLVFNLGFYTIGGVVLYGISFLLYVYLISKYDLGYIIPIATGLVYVLIFVASFVVFSEAFSMLKIFGIGLILIGLVLMNIAK